MKPLATLAYILTLLYDYLTFYVSGSRKNWWELFGFDFWALDGGVYPGNGLASWKVELKELRYAHYFVL